MAFTPEESQSGTPRVYPKIKNGEEGTWSLPARISMIVDVGTQERPNFEEEYEKGKEKHESALKWETNPAVLIEREGKQFISIPQKPNRQVVIFADLVSEKVDYGAPVGEKQYRLMLNKSFKSAITGTPLTVMQARDDKGNVIEGSPKTFHTRSLLNQLGKACGVSFVKNGNDIRELANKPFACTVESKKAKQGDGVFTNFKSATPMMEGVPVAELDEPCQLITFEEATVDQVKTLRKSIIEMIKKSNDYEGSQIEKAIKEMEASRGSNNSSAAPKPEKQETAAPKGFDDFDDDIPF